MIVYSRKMQTWVVYILECSDKTLYTGITTDIKRRIVEHNSGKGARYTRARRPVTLVFKTAAADRSDASKLEYTIKKLSKKEKLALIDGKK